MKYRDCFDQGRKALKEAGITEADLDARYLLEFVCGTDHNTLLAHPDKEVSEEEKSRYEELIGKRKDRIPLQQLTGHQEFMGLDFCINESVLIPRQDTEILVEEAMKELHDGMRVLDLCTGSGCILISLLHYSNDCEGVGVDISGEALKVAKENAARLLGENAKVSFLEGDLYEKAEGFFDRIVSNPPYIRPEVIEGLMPEVKEHEPRIALDGGADGLTFYRRIIAGSKAHLKPGGMLLFEIGCDQAEAVAGLMEEGGYEEIRVIRDYAGLDRVVSGVLKFSYQQD